jgi:hypothetical protein
MIAGHNRAVKPRIIDLSEEPFGEAFRSSANSNIRASGKQGYNSFGGHNIAIQGCENDLGLIFHYDDLKVPERVWEICRMLELAQPICVVQLRRGGYSGVD